MQASRVLFLIMTLTFILVASMVSLDRYLKQSTQELLQEVYAVREFVNNKHYPSSEKAYRQLLSKWQQERKKWFLFVDHSAIDGIHLSILVLNDALTQKDLPRILEELSTTKFLLTNVYENGKFSMPNIL